IPHSDIPVYVVSSGKNSLNNRFLPFDVIRTDSIFSIDDDLTLAKESILLAFRVWRENRDRLVGFPGRYHIWDSEKEKYLYKGSTSTSGFSMVLTGACFFHKHYSYLYTYVMQRAIWEYVEENLNCEDIAMNFLVADITRRPPIKVSKTLFYPCKYCGKKSISTSKSHNRKRIESLNFFSKVYGYMPLIYTQFSTDYLYNAKLYNKYFKNDI
ncbi:exostosin-like 3, partial, partial [Argonauta hians]